MTGTLIQHPDFYATGLRVMFLKARHKDGFKKERRVTRITRNKDEFYKELFNLRSISVEGERIYAAAGPRDFKNAQYEFKHRLLCTERMPQDQQEIWFNLMQERWISSLMAPESASREGRQWLIDCDTPEEGIAVRLELASLGIEPYSYQTKNGEHFVIPPCQTSDMSLELASSIDKNPMMLWAY